MAKLPAAIKAQENIQAETQPQGALPKKRKRDFAITDDRALYAVYPQFFKLSPDYTKIRQAIKLGLSLPGVQFDDDTINENASDGSDGLVDDRTAEGLPRL